MDDNYNYNYNGQNNNKGSNGINKLLLGSTGFLVVVIAFLVSYIFMNGSGKTITYVTPSSDFKVGDSYNLDAKYKGEQLSYVSETPLILEVNKTTGEITAKSEGTGTIRIYVKNDPSIYKYVTLEVKGEGGGKPVKVTPSPTPVVVSPTPVVTATPSPTPTPAATQQAQQPRVTSTPSPTPVPRVTAKPTATPTPKPRVTARPTTKPTATPTPTAKPKVTPTPTPKNVKVTGLTLNKSSVTLVVGKTEQITATVSPSNATNKAVTWSSSNAKVATVDSNGKIKAVSKGTATITAKTKDGGKTKTVKVTVSSPVYVTYVNVSPDYVEYITVGETINFKATVKPADATNKTINWDSSNKTVGTIDKNGTFKALKAGTTVITAAPADGKIGGKYVVVEVIPTKGTLHFDFLSGEGAVVSADCLGCRDQSTFIGKVGSSFNVNIISLPSMSSVKSFSSSKTDVATVAKAKATAECANCKVVKVSCKKEGKTVLKATNNKGGSNSIQITCKKKLM